MMLRELRLGRLAIACSLAVAFLKVAPAIAGGCGYYGCDAVVAPLPYPYRHYHYLIQGPDHDYAPIYFSDGHGGGYYGQWFWGGRSWRAVTPDDYGSYRFGW